MGKMKATLTSNGRSAETYIQLVQAVAGDVMKNQGHAEQQDDKPLDKWQLHSVNNSIIGLIGQSEFAILKCKLISSKH